MTQSRFLRRFVYNVQRYWYGLRDPRSFPMLMFSLAHRSDPPPSDKPRAATTAPGVEAPRAPRHDPSPDLASSHIPKFVYQTWKSRTDLPSNFAIWSQSFQQLNPEFDCMIWDDQDNRDFMTQHFPWFMDYYNGYPKEIFRVDAVRMFFLYRFGGVYADMDTECLKPLDPQLTMGDALFGRMGLDTGFEHSIPNAMMASKPRHLIWLLAISMMMDKYEECGTADEMARRGPETLTGPILLKRAVDYFVSSSEAEIRQRAASVIERVTSDGMAPLHSSNVRILPPEIWYPLDWTNPFHRAFRQTLADKRIVLDRSQTSKLFPKAYMVTYWSHSW